ncbi:LacI family DNA-binding transcriptional regulator [Bacillota bacterium]
MTGIKDVAKRAGVSIATVSNVINERKPVSRELKAKVYEAVEALNYEVNPVGRGLKSNRTNQVGVIVPSFNQVFFPAILKGIQEAATKYGYQLLVFETGGDIEKERQHVRFLERAWIDGIILASQANNDNISEREYIRSLGRSGNRRKRIPAVTLENVLDPELDAVIIDNEKAAAVAVVHLLELGHERIAHIAGPERLQTGKQRRAGFIKTMLESGINPYEELISEGDYSPESGYEAMSAILERNVPFTAVFAANDQMAIGAMRALMDKGKRIPADAAVIGIDNNFPSTLVSPSLTSINIPKHEMGSRAMELLANRIKDTGKPAEIHMLETELIVRKSTSPDGDDKWDLINW